MNNQQLASSINLFVFSKYLLMGFLSIFTLLDSSAQNDELTVAQKTDSALVKAIKLYDNTLGRNSFLYTGRVYYDDYGGIRGHQYFMEGYWSEGEIVYRGQYFDSIYLMYDIYNNQLLLEHFNSSGMLSPVMLHNPSVSSFSIQGHKFVRIEKDTTIDILESFYDQLYKNEKVGIYVLRRKQVSKSNSTSDFYEEFIDANRYYLEKDNVYYRIRKRKDILQVLEDRKKELKKYIKANLLLFRKEPEKTLVSIAKYYQNLTY